MYWLFNSAMVKCSTLRHFVPLDDGIQKAALSASRMAYNEAVEDKPSMLVSLTKEITRLTHYRLYHIFELSTDKTSVYQESIRLHRFLVEGLLPQPNPKLKR